MIILIIELYPPFDQDIFNQDFPNSMEFVFLSEIHHQGRKLNAAYSERNVDTMTVRFTKNQPVRNFF